MTTVLSLAGRLPPFDYAEHDGYSYLRVKSEQLMSVRHVDAKSKK